MREKGQINNFVFLKIILKILVKRSIKIYHFLEFSLLSGSSIINYKSGLFSFCWLVFAEVLHCDLPLDERLKLRL